MFLVKDANERRSRGLFKCFSTKSDRSNGEEFDKKRSDEIERCRQDSDRSTQEKLPDPNSDKVVGMEDEVEKLLRESVLNEQKKGLSIAVVEGMAGIGKTTFAQKIYNHPDVVNRFPYRAWAMVSSKFTPEETMKQLILQLPRSGKQKLPELEESKKDELQEILYKLLQGQTYFVVLDDVREMEHWESLKTAFPNEQDKTSRLLVTTRSKYIAKHERHTHYEMKVLDPEKSWDLFLMKALISDGGCPEELEPIGREIVRRCEGLPLKISKVGGLLVQTRSKRGWQQVLNQESSHLGSHESSVFRSFELSYLSLPTELRLCLLHLVMFKEYATIPAKSLLHLWLVRGLIKVQAGQTAEESARRCLDELISRNMLQIVDSTMGGCVRNVYLHGILREVCLRRANEVLGLETVNTPHAVNVNGAYCVRRPISITSWENIETLKYMRQEDWMECYSRQSYSCNVRKLGLVLDPLSKPDEWSKVRASLESLRTLDYLQLRWNRFIPFDPQIIPKLHTLTKLKLRGKLIKCPDITIFPPNLSHLTLAFSDLSEDLMPQLSKLPNLSHLKLLGNAYKPEKIQVLSSSSTRLQVLILKEMFHLKSIYIVRDGMPYLKQLQIQQCPSLRTMNLTQGIVVKFIT